jgi:hypothetical protein
MSALEGEKDTLTFSKAAIDKATQKREQELAIRDLKHHFEQRHDH